MNLLNNKSYDGGDYEEIQICVQRGNEILSALNIKSTVGEYEIKEAAINFADSVVITSDADWDEEAQIEWDKAYTFFKKCVEYASINKDAVEKIKT